MDLLWRWPGCTFNDRYYLKAICPPRLTGKKSQGNGMSETPSSQLPIHTSFDMLKPVVSRWLEWQCKMISEVKIGTVFLTNENSDNVTMIASWPAEDFTGVLDQLNALAIDVVEGRKAIPSKLSCHLNDDDTVCDTITLPLRHKNKIIGAVIFLQSVRSEEQKKAVFQLFQWGAAWLETTLVSALEESGYSNPFSNSLIKLALQDEPAVVTGHQLCNALAEHFQCKRVVLGEVEGLQVHTLALSNQLRFDARSTHVRDMEVAMEESLDQKMMIQYPKPEEMVSLVTQKHQTLSRLNDDAEILTLPFLDTSGVTGVFLLMRLKNHIFTKEEVKVLQSTSEVLGAALSLKLRKEHSVSKVFFQGFKKKLQFLFGAENLTLKLALSGVFAVLVTLMFVKTPYYIYAKSSLEGAIQHVIVAPYDGFVESATVRAGEKVVSAQTLVQLNDHNLKLEHLKLLSERDKIKKEYREALVLRERAKVSILSAQVSQVDVKLSLVNEKLKRSAIKAPFSGIVVSGDLSQSLGAPVEKGEALFKISPLGDYRVILNVDNEDISKLKIGEEGSLRLVGLPYEEIAITVSRIIPIASAKNGGNYFRVEASFSDTNETRLKPGMQGIAKVEVGEESILWVISHTFIERISLWFWSLG